MDGKKVYLSVDESVDGPWMGPVPVVGGIGYFFGPFLGRDRGVELESWLDGRG